MCSFAVDKLDVIRNVATCISDAICGYQYCSKLSYFTASSAVQVGRNTVLSKSKIKIKVVYLIWSNRC